jgi:hypothetical protein
MDVRKRERRDAWEVVARLTLTLTLLLTLTPTPNPGR